MNLLERVAKAYGMESFAISGIPLPGDRIDPYVLLNAWPEEWFERYSAMNYVQVDPVIARTKSTNDAFVWAETIPNRPMRLPERRVMDEAREFGMIDGFSVPVHGIDGLQAIVTFSARQVDLSLEMQATLQLIAIYAHNRLRQMMRASAGDREEAPNITPREKEVLKWLAAGKVGWETAQILSVSEYTVRNHIENLRTKMNVVNVAQLIAEAFRRGILR